MPPYEVIRILAALILACSVLFNVYIHHYVVRLERIGCRCAMDYRRTYIQWYTLIWIALCVVNITLLLMGTMMPPYMALLITPITSVATVFYIVFVLQYVSRLYKEKCDCSKSLARPVLTLVTIIYTAMLCFSALYFLVLALMGASVRR